MELSKPELEKRTLGPNDLPAWTDEALFDACGVRIAFTTRAGGVSEGDFASLNCGSNVPDDPQAVQRNRQLVLQALGAPHAPLVVPRQVHGTDTILVEREGQEGDVPPERREAPSAWLRTKMLRREDSGSVSGNPTGLDSAILQPKNAGAEDCGEAHKAEPESSRRSILVRSQAESRPVGFSDQEADAVIVGVPGVAALLNFADCLPVIIVSPSGRFAVAHAGWRGAVAHIAAQTARELARDDAYEPAQFNAYIGPHIHAECFEVGPEVAEQFARAFGPASVVAPAADVEAANPHVSLARAVTLDLVAAGLQEGRIADVAVCTMCSPQEYFSHRASQGRCGRHSAAAVKIEQED